MVSLERYTKALSSVQRAFLVNNAGEKPLDRKKVLTDVRYSPAFNVSYVSYIDIISYFSSSVLNIFFSFFLINDQ